MSIWPESDTACGAMCWRRRTEMELLTQRLASLLTVKSLVTVILTAVFAAMAGTGRVTAEQFLTVFTVVIAFYFGTQAEKRARE